MPDASGFLGAYPPFDGLQPDELGRVAGVAETEFSASGTTIFSQGAGPVEYLRVVRSGAVEVRHDGRILDLLGPGELFGQASMISGLPTGFEARAAADTVCYRIPAGVMRPLLARPDVLRFVVRSIVGRAGTDAGALGTSAYPVEGRVATMRRDIDLAGSTADLAATAAGLNPMIIALHDAQAAAEQVAAVRSVVLDALIRRLAELAVRDAGPAPALLTWFALGSVARREAVPSSDVDSALAWEDAASVAEAASGTASVAGAGDAGVREYTVRVGRAVDEGLRACGITVDAHGASAANPLFARSRASWRAAAESLSQDPTQDKALILVSVITDSRPVWGTGGQGGLWAPGARPDADLLRLLARFALSFRPPTGFLRDFVVEHSGERRGQLDLKSGGLIPIVDLARWAAMAAGVASASTMERLRAAEAAGTLESQQARTLMEAFGFISSLRLDHQVEQLRRGEAPDDFIDPKTLNPLARSYLREAFRAVASVQTGLANELAMGIR